MKKHAALPEWPRLQLQEPQKLSTRTGSRDEWARCISSILHQHRVHSSLLSGLLVIGLDGQTCIYSQGDLETCSSDTQGLYLMIVEQMKIEEKYPPPNAIANRERRVMIELDGVHYLPVRVTHAEWYGVSKWRTRGLIAFTSPVFGLFVASIRKPVSLQQASTSLDSVIKAFRA